MSVQLLVRPFVLKSLARTATPTNGDAVATTISLASQAGVRGAYGYSTPFKGRVRLQHSTNPAVVVWTGSQWQVAYNSTVYYHSAENVQYPWLVNTWIADNGSFPVLPVFTTPVLGTLAKLDQEAVVNISSTGRLYSFKCVSEYPAVWTPLTSGVLWDPAPVTGVARYRRLVFIGTGDDHTTEYADL